MRFTARTNGIVAIALLVGLTWATPARADKEDRDFLKGETAYLDGNYRRALVLLDDFVQRYDESSYREKALYMAAESASALEKWSIARGHYDDLIREFPETGYLLRARFGRALAMAGEGRTADAVEALMEVGPQLEDARDRHRCYRTAVQVELGRRRYLDALEPMGLLVDDGAAWREEDELALEQIAGSLEVEELLAWEKERRGTSAGGLALYAALHIEGLDEDAQTVDPRVYLFADEYPDHPFASRIEALRGQGLQSPTIANKIGVLLPLSGNYRRPGSDVLDGITMGVEDFHGTSVQPKLAIRDTEGDPDKAVEMLVELVEQEQVIAVLGPLLSNNAIPVAEKAQELRVPIVVLSQAEGVPQVGRYVFRNFLTPEAQVDAIADYAIDRQGIRDFALFYPSTEQGARMADRFWFRVEDSGCRVTAVESYADDETDFRKPLRRLYGKLYVDKGVGAVDLELPYLEGRSKPHLPDGHAAMLTPGSDFQGVFVPDGYKQVSMIAPAMVYEDINLADTYQSKPPVTLLGGASLNNPEFVKRGGRYVRGALFVDAFFVDSTDPLTSGFVRRFRSIYQRDPGLLEALGYDSLMIVATMLDQDVASRPTLRRMLSTVRIQDSITGALGFDRAGEMERELVLLTVEEESIVQLWPVPIPEELQGFDRDVVPPGGDTPPTGDGGPEAPEDEEPPAPDPEEPPDAPQEAPGEASPNPDGA